MNAIGNLTVEVVETVNQPEIPQVFFDQQFLLKIELDKRKVEVPDRV